MLSMCYVSPTLNVFLNAVLLWTGSPQQFVIISESFLYLLQYIFFYL